MTKVAPEDGQALMDDFKTTAGLGVPPRSAGVMRRHRFISAAVPPTRQDFD
ncbi:hypothetical protein [Nocardia sp. NPDC052112]|uniref:hypothetical protein n=1 Tax=Nocardia sp. NPDC052112 TaxID=3155646 RepID=UPI0034136A1E